MILTRDEILEIGVSRKTQSLAVPEWGGEVLLREISAGEYDKLQVVTQHALDNKEGNTQIRGLWVAAFLANEDGSRLFKDSEINKIAAMGAKAIDRIYEAGQLFNALDEAEDLEKN